MKNFTANVEGPLGPWYRKVNDPIALAARARTIGELRGILGEPDTIQTLSADDRKVAYVVQLAANALWTWLPPRCSSRVNLGRGSARTNGSMSFRAAAGRW